MQLRTSLTLTIALLVIDFITKRWVESALTHGQEIPLTAFFNLVLTYNAGAAFSFLSDESGWQRWFLSGVSASASVFIVYLLYKHAAEKLFCIALSLILSGALGNLWDRMLLGHVVDFIDLHYDGYHWPAFNVADSIICIGAAFLILESARSKEVKN